MLNKSSLLFKAILIPIYPINKYTNIPTIAVIIGRFINVPIPLTIKYAITKPTIRPIVANNISDWGYLDISLSKSFTPSFTFDNINGAIA